MEADNKPADRRAGDEIGNSNPVSVRERRQFNADFRLDWHDPNEAHDGYQLKWVGKSYARLEAGTAPDTMLIPDAEHNRAPENSAAENLFFTGDNLQMLKHLRNAYKGAVKMIYIDPPYNTGSDGFVYKDRFEFSDEQLKNMLGLSDEEVKRLHIINGRSSHSAWLSFMYPRLKIAKELLRDDGAIFISIDDNEQANLKLLCDEIFVEGNYIGDVIRKTKSATNDAGTGLNYQHEFVLIYAINSAQISIVGDKKDVSHYKNPDNDPAGAWVSDNPSARSGGENSRFEIVNPYTGGADLPPQGRYWAFAKATFENWVKSGKVKFREKIVEGQRGFIVKKYLAELKSNYNLLDSLFGVDNNYMNQVATKELNALLTDGSFIYPKPVAFIKKLIASLTTPSLSENGQSPIILDFFAGSGTTAQAVMELNAEDGGDRRYILCQLDEKVKPGSEVEHTGYRYQTIDQIARERVKRAAAKLARGLAGGARKEKLEDNSGLPADACPFGFRHYYIKPPHAQTIDKITEFDPDKLALIAEDMVAEFAAPAGFGGSPGEEVLLTTWAVADGYTAHYAGGSRLYLIAPGWGAEQTKALLNRIGTYRLNVNTLILYGYSFTFESLRELENNVRQSLDEPVQIIKRY